MISTYINNLLTWSMLITIKASRRAVNEAEYKHTHGSLRMDVVSAHAAAPDLFTAGGFGDKLSVPD